MSDDPNVIQVEHPPCLRRRAPARIELTRDGSTLPQMTAAYVHIRAGHRLKIRVIPPAGGAGSSRDVRVECSPALQVISPPAIVTEGREQSTYLEVVARFRSKLPLPHKAAIHITTTSVIDQPAVTTVWVAVWPSVWTILSWLLTGFVATLVIGKFVEVARGHGLFEALQRVLTDIVFLSQAFLIGSAVSAVIYISSWLLVWLDWAPSDSE